MVFLCFSKGLFQVISIFLSKVCYSIVQRVLSVLMIDKVDTTSGLSLKLLRGAWLLQILPMPIFQQHHMNSQMASMFSMPPSNMYLKLCSSYFTVPVMFFNQLVMLLKFAGDWSGRLRWEQIGSKFLTSCSILPLFRYFMSVDFSGYRLMSKPWQMLAILVSSS